MTRLENVLKLSLQDVLKKFSRRLEDILARRLEGVLKRFWRRLQKVLKTSCRCLEDVLKTSWKRLEDAWPRRIYWSWPTRLEDVLKMSSEEVRPRWTYSSWSRRLEDVFKTFSEEENERRLQDIFKASSSRRMFGGELHFRCCTWVELDIVTWCRNFLKGIGRQPDMIECNLGKLWKTHSPGWRKNTFPEVFHIEQGFFAFNIK